MGEPRYSPWFGTAASKGNLLSVQLETETETQGVSSLEPHSAQPRTQQNPASRGPQCEWIHSLPDLIPTDTSRQLCLFPSTSQGTCGSFQRGSGAGSPPQGNGKDLELIPAPQDPAPQRGPCGLGVKYTAPSMHPKTSHCRGRSAVRRPPIRSVQQNNPRQLPSCTHQTLGTVGATRFQPVALWQEFLPLPADPSPC